MSRKVKSVKTRAPRRGIQKAGKPRALAIAADKYAKLVEQAAEGIIVVASNGRFMLANDKFCRMTGYTRRELLKLNILDTYVPEEKEIGRRRLAQISAGQPMKFQRPVVRKDGSIFLSEISALKVADGGLQAIVQDITQRKAVEDRLVESEERLRTIFNESNDGIFVVDPQTRQCCFSNEKGAEMFGYSQEELGGLKIEDFHPAEDVAYVVDQFNKLFRREIALVKEIRAKRKDGSIFYLDISGFSVNYGGEKYLVGFLRDVTEYKKAQEEIRWNEEKFKKAFQNSPSPMAISTLDEGRYIDVNKSFCETFHMERDEAIGKTYVELNLFTDPGQRTTAIQKVKQGESVRDWELVFRTRTGEELYGLYSAEGIEFQNAKYLLGIMNNITERKKLENQLRQGEERYRNLFELSPDGIIITRLDGSIFAYNRAILQASGYTEEDLKKANVRDIYLNVERRNEMIAIIQAQGRVRDFELPLKRKDGSTFYTLMNVDWVELEGQKMFFSTLRDITELKRVQDHLRMSEERYRLLAENARDVIWTMDFDGHFTYFSPSVKQQRGYTPEEATALTLGQTLTPPSVFLALKVLNDAVTRVKAGAQQESVRMELEHYRKDGSIIWCDVLCSIMFDSSRKPVGFMGITRDITERKLAEAALRESEQRYRILADNISDVVWILDLNMHFTYFSPSVKQKFGFTPEEMLLKRIDEVLSPDSFRMVVSAIAEELEEERSGQADPKRSRVIEAQEYRRDGSLVFIEIIASFLRDEKGHPVGILGVTRDISERKRIENELRESHQNLEAKVKERTIELEEANQKLLETTEDLKQAMKVKSDFLANMSHELRTPLNSINGFSEVLFDETFGPLNKKQKEYLKYILVSGKHLLSLINDVLDMAKMEAGKEKLTLSIVFIKDLLEESLALVQEMAMKKKITTSLELPQGIGYIEADERKIKEIVYNLLSNSIKFTPEGGKIGIRAKRLETEMEVSVFDTGIGILPEDIDKIFQAFLRLETPYTRLTEGTGLGLAFSRKLVELHGGKIWVESEGLNKGSVFKFTVPLKPFGNGR